MPLNITKSNWWETDQYTVDSVLGPLEEQARWGPQGPALVRAFDSGATQEGWGLTGKRKPGSDELAPGFMPRYNSGEFFPKRTLFGYERGKHNAALVMRSIAALCVDIDGKNGGLQYASSLGALGVTSAEISKSGNGYHLFYATPEDWDETTGFGDYADVIGIVQGVDIRAVGCVYHHPQQRWNERPLAPAPDWLLDRLREKKERRAAQADAVQKIQTLDETEILMAQHALLEELAKPIKAGARNNTLFAIGNKLRQAGVENWQAKVQDRGNQVGLDSEELGKLIENIERQP